MGSRHHELAVAAHKTMVEYVQVRSQAERAAFCAQQSCALLEPGVARAPVRGSRGFAVWGFAALAGALVLKFAQFKDVVLRVGA